MILTASLLLKLHHLDHPALKPLDEVFHAIVARNFLKHPFTPTLVDRPFLAYDARNWQANHIWLHKPPLALWQIACSFTLLGVNAFALRLPSAILSTGAVVFTYLIGLECEGSLAALIAAGLQAFNPVLLMVVNGYVFSDHVDIALLFWTEAGIYCLARAMRTGALRDVVLCGAAQGLAFLCKSYPALIITGLGLVLWLLPRSRLISTRTRLLSGRRLLLLIGVTLVVALPWNLAMAIRFPTEFAIENGAILRHLNQNVEGWAAPWNRVIFDYWISVFHVFYPLVLVAAALTLLQAARRGDPRRWFLLAWAVGVTAPNLLATSKTMTATLTAWPALWLLAGGVVARALAGGAAELGAWLVTAVLAACLLAPASIPSSGWGYENAGNRAGITLGHEWVLGQSSAGLIGAAIALLVYLRLGARQRIQAIRSAIAVAIVASTWLCVRGWGQPRGYLDVAWQVTQIDKSHPNFLAVGAFAHRLTPNAAFIVDEHSALQDKLAEFATGRTCYAQPRDGWRDMASALVARGALPYLLTTDPAQAIPVVFVDPVEGWRVYACTPAAQIAAEALGGSLGSGRVYHFQTQR